VGDTVGWPQACNVADGFMLPSVGVMSAIGPPPCEAWAEAATA